MDFPTGLRYLRRPGRLPGTTDPSDPARLSALRPLLELDFLESEFVVEQGQTDGTMAHAVERAIGISTAVAGYRLETIEQLIGEPVPPTDRRYAYANRS